MQKVLSLILALTLLLVSCSVFSAAESAFDPKSVCSGVTLKVAVPELTRISDWKANKMTKYIEDTLGVNLVFEVYPNANFYDKINAMVMAGDKLPDLIIFPGGSKNYVNWAAEGAILELSKFYADENLSANIRKAGEGAGYDIASRMKDGDGLIYGLPRLEQGLGMESWQRFWVYKPWLDAMGREVPTTIDEFLEACRYVATHDMNGNGDTTDEYVIMGNGFNSTSNGFGDWFEPLMSAFIYAWDPNFAVVENGNVSFAYTTDAWKEGIKYIKKNFFDEKLIGTEIFTNSVDDCRAHLYADGPTCFAFSGWTWEGGKPEIEAGYVATTLKGPQGQGGKSQYMPIFPSAGGVISATCENPEAAFLVADLMCGEYLSLVTRYGEEGKHWAYWDQAKSENVIDPADYEAQGGKEHEIKWVTPYADSTFWSSTASQDISWLQAGVFIRNADLQLVRALKVRSDDETEKLKIFNIKKDIDSKLAGIANAPAQVMDFYPLTTDEYKTANEIQITLNNYVNEMNSSFLVGYKDIDAEWDNYLKQLQVIGIDKLQKIYQTAYTRAH